MREDRISLFEVPDATYWCCGPNGIGHYHHTCKDGMPHSICLSECTGVYVKGPNVYLTGTRHEGGSDRWGYLVDIWILV